MKHSVILISTCLFSLLCAAQANSDAAAVRQACFNYIDAFYKSDTALAYASVHPSLQKRGFSYNKAQAAYSGKLEMPFPALVKLASVWNKDGTRTKPDSPRAVDLFEVSDKTASAKVTAVWGIDYLHLVKENGIWYIINVLWQSPPQTASAP